MNTKLERKVLDDNKKDNKYMFLKPIQSRFEDYANLFMWIMQQQFVNTASVKNACLNICLNFKYNDQVGIIQTNNIKLFTQLKQVLLWKVQGKVSQFTVGMKLDILDTACI
ncbi:unnamed protein product (macronuclear) [Paramecium tetraurelia]|uniref:Uncharacterized protein n=1 Tax=Paramecium tetraurelia TaxID=5888 RepID=A0CTP3_PARTE|nr:uncharacterized protein GSPATT00010394001 [Paramecium tetraurelia]CAK74160.1 unnamed protein product [Paramecium tetraurelia]|eukprot:XP_001441557.1 hypothetical protein (macronuclear) [Paramecium tetraurelia strain d4-2]